MDATEMTLEKVSHPIQIRFSFPPYPDADLKTIQVDLPEGALLLDAIRQSCVEHHVPVYLEHSFLSTAQNLIQETRRATINHYKKRVNENIFAKRLPAAEGADVDIPIVAGSENNVVTRDLTTESSTKDKEEKEDKELRELQKNIIANYRTYTRQFYTQPEENLFPEAYHTLVHSPIPSLFDAILELEREYAGEVDALLSARDAEINEIQTKHNNALASDTPQRNLTHLMTRHIERMEVSQATWNSQLDDLQSAQRTKYQEFILELFEIYKRQHLYANHSAQTGGASDGVLLNGKDMVEEAMRTIGARISNVESTLPDQQTKTFTDGERQESSIVPQPHATASQTSQLGTMSQSLLDQPVEATIGTSPIAQVTDTPIECTKNEVNPELQRMIKSILEMGFDEEQAKGALLIANRDMDHAINLLLEQPENIQRLVLAKQKTDALKERVRARGQSSPQQPSTSLIGANTVNSAISTQASKVQQAGRAAERSASVSSPRPLSGMFNHGPGANAAQQKPWSPLPFLQQKNALLSNSTSPSVKKFGGWLNKAIENLGLDDDFDDSASRNSGNSYNSRLVRPPVPKSNLDESFTVVLGSSHSKVTHNLRLMVSDPAEVFPSHRNKSEQDAAIHAQTASSLYGQNLTGLVLLVNINDWAKYKFGRTCHQEFFKACQTSTELHFDSIERQLETLEAEFPLDGSTIQEGDFILTRHSNLPMVHVVFHLFYGQTPKTNPSGDSSTPQAPLTHQPIMFSQSADFVPKPNFLTGLRNIIRIAHRYEITMLSIPFLMMPSGFESQLVASMTHETTISSSSRHQRHGSNYGSSSLSTVPTTSLASSSSFTRVSNNVIDNSHFNNNGGGVVYYITDQTRRDLHRRSELLLRHLKSFLMDSARQVKQVGNQGSEAEKFRASQGGDIKVIQFLLPKGTNDEMFRAFRSLLVNVFGGA
ncbi:hypothetical protein BX616_001797 [Lobosporangium transversale]|uniref:UBA domain-containing protein n=1 Tax=Lobosporangium transversale TaxID=64571 RepID=A0A1Y2GJK3_9FUNG|nr:hypothetical protein BCR41DRAFT_423001 [Lobosporangium transversale]KAF9917156.1 hypothetical protein BX616_001797 [Lobosporangium transversale]ORZ12920.1 hypothetical protein BCR41DRAFT_423001 [Lobosporangium transversale]|eukprot:XP_021880269.1 hypothetical protein BCR41DRAFT_423001 [Lobosporangium transversale]